MLEVSREGAMVVNIGFDIPALVVETKNIMNRLKKRIIRRIKRSRFGICRFTKGFLSKNRVTTEYQLSQIYRAT
jgi:hypothetical protein